MSRSQAEKQMQNLIVHKKYYKMNMLNKHMYYMYDVSHASR